MFSSFSTQKFEFLVDLTRNGKRQFYLKSFKKRDAECPLQWSKAKEELVRFVYNEKVKWELGWNCRHLYTPANDSEWEEFNKARSNMKAWLSCSAYARWTRYFLYGQAFCAQRSQCHWKYNCVKWLQNAEAAKITTTIRSTTVKRFVTSLIFFWYSANSMMKLGVNVQK